MATNHESIACGPDDLAPEPDLAEGALAGLEDLAVEEHDLPQDLGRPEVEADDLALLYGTGLTREVLEADLEHVVGPEHARGGEGVPAGHALEVDVGHVDRS